MNELSYTKTYGKDAVQTYQNISFTVEEQIETIELSYSYQRFRMEPNQWGVEKKEINIIDLGLFSADGQLRGWSGSERLSVTISEHHATPGYKRGPIIAGTWHVALGIYKVETEAIVEVTIKMIPKKRRYFKGDLHMHTLNSDGKYSTSEVVSYAKHAQMDFIALTDHNNTQQNDEIGNPEGITVIAGMEYTNYRGHANFYFPHDAHCQANPLSNTKEEMLQAFQAARQKDALICINHPFDDSCPWLFGFDFDFPLVEVWNGFFKPSDAKAIAWWHDMLVEGRRLVAIGGSDTHKIEMGRSYGTPTTWVHALSRGKEDICRALAEGRVSVSASPSSAQLELQIGEATIGEKIAYSDDMKAEIHVSNAKKGDRIILFSDAGEETQYSCPYSGDITFAFGVEGRKFYRVELYRKMLDLELLDAFTNPIYLL